MVGRSKPASKLESDRMALIKEQAWCMPCILIGKPNRPYTTIQHVVEGNKRLGHRYTYGCCPYHHLGHVPDGIERQEMLQEFGVSLAWSRKEYRAQFGKEKDLVSLQDELIWSFEKSPWKQYHMPRHVQHEIRRKWHRLRDTG